jgi:hypothetical protein
MGLSRNGGYTAAALPSGSPGWILRHPGGVGPLGARTGMCYRATDPRFLSPVLRIRWLGTPSARSLGTAFHRPRA